VGRGPPFVIALIGRPKWIRWEGISVHIGSQIVSLEPFGERWRASRITSASCATKDLPEVPGFWWRPGRFATRQRSRHSRQAYARMVAQMVRRLGLHLCLSRSHYHGPGGDSADARAVYKKNGGKTFVVVDGRMNDLMRPHCMAPSIDYSAYAGQRWGDRSSRSGSVGPVAKRGDCFLRDWPLGRVAVGDVLGFGGLGHSEWRKRPNYNARCPASRSAGGRFAVASDPAAGRLVPIYCVDSSLFSSATATRCFGQKTITLEVKPRPILICGADFKVGFLQRLDQLQTLRGSLHSDFVSGSMGMPVCPSRVRKTDSVFGDTLTSTTEESRTNGPIAEGVRADRSK